MIVEINVNRNLASPQFVTVASAKTNANFLKSLSPAWSRLQRYVPHRKQKNNLYKNVRRPKSFSTGFAGIENKGLLGLWTQIRRDFRRE